MTSSQDTTIAELVSDTLDWVNYGEPNPTDLIDLATIHFDVAANNLGFKSNDEEIVAAAEFRHDAMEDAEASTCVVRLSSALKERDVIPGGAELTFEPGTTTLSYPTHEEALTAFYQWCQTGAIPN